MFSCQPRNLAEMEQALRRELELLDYPPAPWIANKESSSLFDVVIIGAGMAGLSAAFALKKQGIGNIQLYDASPEGYEGPWLTYARMLTLRSWKGLTGPALNIPHLTFKAWYSALHGENAWEELYKIPNRDWMDYLIWYRRVLKLPVANEHQVLAIQPEHDHLTLTVLHQGQQQECKTRKVVLANGRGGLGGDELPTFIRKIPKQYYSHTCENIDFLAFKGKSLGIIGVGASAFDAAAAALEIGCYSVDLICRRARVPCVNKAIQIIYPGFSGGYYLLPDEARWQIFNHIYAEGAPPPFEALDRIQTYANVHVKCNTAIHHASLEGSKVLLETSQGPLTYDHLILGTGFAVDITREPMLHAFKDKILLWKDRPFEKKDSVNHKQERFPYLGPHFQFLEKTQGSAPFLKDIYCFNWAATLSHALLSSDIPDISIGATRLAKGIAADFFTQDWKTYDTLLQKFQRLEFEEEKYPFFR